MYHPGVSHIIHFIDAADDGPGRREKIKCDQCHSTSFKVANISRTIEGDHNLLLLRHCNKTIVLTMPSWFFHNYHLEVPGVDVLIKAATNNEPLPRARRERQRIPYFAYRRCPFHPVRVVPFYQLSQRGLPGNSITTSGLLDPASDGCKTTITVPACQDKLQIKSDAYAGL